MSLTLRAAMLTLVLGSAVAGPSAEPLDTYVDTLYPRYPVLDFPVIQGLPETESELRKAYPGVEQTYNRFIEFGVNQCLPEFGLTWLETAHVNWGRPYAKGRLKVLFVKYNSSAEGGQDIREIGERMDIEPSLLMVPSTARANNTSQLMPVGVDLALRRAAEVLDRDYDVIVMNDQVHHLSEDLLATIKNKVQAGTGLVFFRADVKMTNGVTELLPLTPCGGMRDWGPANRMETRDHYLTRGVPFGVFPATNIRESRPLAAGEVLASVDGHPLLAVGTAGQGRTVAITYGWSGLVGHGYSIKPTDQFEDLIDKRYPWWEYNFAWIARAVLWAARREAEVSVRLAGPETPVAFGAPIPLRVELAGPEAGQKHRVQLRLRGPEYEPEAELSESVKWRGRLSLTADLGGGTLRAGTESGRPAAPATLRPGRHFVDCLVRDADGRAVEWGSTTFEVAPAVQGDVTVTPEVIGNESTVDLTVKVDALNAELRAQTCRLEVEAWDSWQRKLDAQEHDLPWGQTIRVPVSVGGTQSVIVRIRARIRSPRGVVFDTTRECFRPKFGWDDWKTIVWRRNQRYANWRQEIESYRALGFAAAYANTWPHRISFYRKFAEVGIEPMVVGWDYEDIKKNAVGEVLRRYGGLFLTVADEWRPPFWGTWDLPFGGKDEYRDLIHGRTKVQSLDREDFVNWLKSRYGGDLAAFNGAWGSSLESWEAFKPLTTEEVLVRGKLAGWLEPRLYFDEVVEREYDRVYRQYAEEAGAPVMVGFDGCFSFQGTFIGGMDYTRMCRDHQTIGLYHAEDGQELMGHTCVADIVSSLSPPWTFFSLTSGSCYGPKESYFTDPWLIAFRGGRGWLVYNASTLTSDFGALYRRGTWVRDATRELREGVGKLLMQSVPDRPEVGILYCTPSTYLHTLRNRADRTEPAAFAWVQGRHAYTRLFRDMQVPFRYLHWHRPSTDALKGLKLVCLTSCEFIPPEWAEVLEGFVRDGGVVFADMPVGTHDGHGNPGGGERFDRLFGIRQTAGAPKQQSPCYSGGLTELNSAKVRFPVQRGGWYPVSVYADAFEVTDGVPVGVNYIPDERPALVCKETGKGLAMVATFLLDGYVAHGAREKVALYYHDLMRALMARAGCVQAKVVTAPEDPSAVLPGLFVNGFSSPDGRVQHLTVMRGRSLPQDEVLCRFGRSGHLYDVRGGAYLGEGTEARIRLGRGPDRGATLLTSLPYRVAKVSIQAPRSVGRGELLSLEMALEVPAEPPATHVLRLELLDPDGERADPYCRNVVADAGRARVDVPLALNEKPGNWRVTVRDVISGTTTHAQIRVR